MLNIMQWRDTHQAAVQQMEAESCVGHEYGVDAAKPVPHVSAWQLCTLFTATGSA